MEQLAEAQYDDILQNRIRQIPLPARFSAETLLAAIRSRDLLPGVRELKRGVDDETVRIAQLLEKGARSASKELVNEARQRLRDEVSAFRRRSHLLLRQRTRNFHWTMICLTQGSAPARIATRIARSYLWESLQLWILDQVTLPEALEASRRAKSRREQDKLARGLLRNLRNQGEGADRALARRDRVLLYLDVWNSAGLDEIYSPKVWRAEAVSEQVLEGLLGQMDNATDELAHLLKDVYGAEQVAAQLAPSEDERDYSRDYFEALCEEGTV